MMNPSTTTSKPNESKREQILSGAREVFMESGYAVASMERIAKTAGVSKGTLYNYFESKEMLFVALIEAECCKSEGQIFPPSAYSDADLEATLNQIGQQWLMGLVDVNQRVFFRIVLAEVMQFPELGQALEKGGPAPAIEEFGQYLAHLNERQILDIPNPILAAEQFFALCDAGIIRKMQLSVCEPTAEIINQQTQDAVKLFLRGYRR